MAFPMKMRKLPRRLAKSFIHTSPVRKFSIVVLALFIVVFGIAGDKLLFHGSAASSSELSYGDINGDGVVSVLDLSALLTTYGTTNTADDINGDGSVNVLDLSVLLSHYGTPVPEPPVGGIWSSAYYPGWLQSGHTMASLPWSGMTQINDFSLMTSTARNGSIVLGHSLTTSNMQALVTAAHQHGIKINISIGGAEDNNFDAACSTTNRSTFVSNLISYVTTYEFDGVDLDIEQDFNHTDYQNCVHAIRTALDQLPTPRKTLTMSADPDWQAGMASLVQQYVDQINLMSYWGTVTDIPAELNNYTSLGIPASKLGVGIGLNENDMTEYKNPASCNAKAGYVAANGYGGVMEWTLTDDQDQNAGKTPCFDNIASYMQ